MHELSIATNLVTIASDAVRDANEQRAITALRVRIGDLAGVVHQALEFAWPIAAENTPCHHAELVIERVPATLHCESCDTTTTLAQPPRFACSTCGKPSNNITAGRELELTAIELEDTPTEPNPQQTEQRHAAAHP